MDFENFELELSYNRQNETVIFINENGPLVKSSASSFYSIKNKEENISDYFGERTIECIESNLFIHYDWI